MAGVAGSFTLDDLREAVDGDFLDAGRGVPDLDAPGGWKMYRSPRLPALPWRGRHSTRQPCT